MAKTFRKSGGKLFGDTNLELGKKIEEQQKIADYFRSQNLDVPESVTIQLSNLKGEANPNKKQLGAQKIIYKDREFDSRSEADFCKWLVEDIGLVMNDYNGSGDDCDFHTQIEVELQPAFQTYNEKLRAINIFPDFLIRPRNVNITGIILDIKGYMDNAQHFKDKWKMLKYKFRDLDYDYFCPSGKIEIEQTKIEIKKILIKGGWQVGNTQNT